MDVKISVPSRNSTLPKISSKPREDELKPTAEAKFLCANFGHLSQTMQFVVFSCGVFFFYLLYGYFQELIFTLEEFKPFGWYLTLVQFAYYTFFGWVERHIKQEQGRKIPLKTYVFLALLTVGTMGFSNASLGHLNYPTQVIFKCCKLIPVMVGSILIQGKKYGSMDFVAAGCMCVGLVLFTLGDSKVSPLFDMVGITMISTALLFDAMIGNIQEKSMKAHNASSTEVVMYSYSIGFLYIFILVNVTGEFTTAMEICQKYPLQTYGYALVFSLTGYLGVQIVLRLVRTCGAFVAVTVTTFRKAISIVLSFIFFSKPFTNHYVWSGLLVVLGIYLNLYSKNKQNMRLQDITKWWKYWQKEWYSRRTHKRTVPKGNLTEV